MKIKLHASPPRTRHAHCLICYERITRPNKPIDENLRDACISSCSSDISLKSHCRCCVHCGKILQFTQKQAQLNEYFMK